MTVSGRIGWWTPGRIWGALLAFGIVWFCLKLAQLALAIIELWGGGQR
jgi:hypothetical protein